MITRARTETAARPAAEWDDLWRPSWWRRQPEWPQDPGIQLIAILALVLYANVIVNEVLAPPWYVPFNLGLMGVALLLARSSGTSWVSMGMRLDHLRRGASIGALVGVAVIAVLVVAVVVPASREAFRDDRIVEGSFALSMYHALFRVPLGTGLYEEVLFRGIIFGVLARRTTALSAAMWSSLLFGIWHVLPALDAIDVNPIGEAIGGTWVPVIGAVVSTFAVGLGFVWLRLYSGSLLAPILVHIAANSTALVAAAVVVYVL